MGQSLNMEDFNVTKNKPNHTTNHSTRPNPIQQHVTSLINYLENTPREKIALTTLGVIIFWALLK
jgi:hypothetical protein